MNSSIFNYVDLRGLDHVRQGTSEAILSSYDKLYRYGLSRVWDPTLNTMVWVMLNPSTADASLDDQTIRKCCGFARLHGCGSIVVVNLFAYRSTDPKQLTKVQDPAGPANLLMLTTTLDAARQRGWRVVAGWGRLPSRSIGALADLSVRRVAQATGVRCFGVTRDGSPRHPCMLGYATPLVSYVPILPPSLLAG